MLEDRRKICELLLKTLQATREFEALVSLEFKWYSPNFQIVTATFANGAEKLANVSMDSGVAMIRDILKQID